MTDEKPPRERLTVSWPTLEQRRRAVLIDPDRPAARIVVGLTGEEARQLSYMAEAWLDEFSPREVYDARDIGVWDKETVLRAMRKLDAKLWPRKKIPRARKPVQPPAAVADGSPGEGLSTPWPKRSS